MREDRERSEETSRHDSKTAGFHNISVSKLMFSLKTFLINFFIFRSPATSTMILLFVLIFKKNDDIMKPCPGSFVQHASIFPSPDHE